MNACILIDRATQWFSNKTAVVCNGKKRTFTEIGENSNRFANGLISFGLKKGDRVALYADNSVECFEIVFGLFKSGIVGVGINTMLSAKEAAYMIADSGARVVVTSPRMASNLSLMKSNIPSVEKIICIGRAPDGIADYEDYYKFVQNQPPTPLKIRLEEDDLVQLFYTGGTTGNPKGVMITHRILNNVILNLQTLYQANQWDVALSPGSLAHSNGYSSLLFFINGVKIIIPEGYDPPDILKTIEKEKVTLLPGFPTTLIRLIDYPYLEGFNLNSLRLIIYGASPMPSEKLKKALEIFGPKLSQGYGQAEALMTITFLSPADHSHALAERPERLASCGRPYLTQEIRVVDEKGKEVPIGQTGEVLTRGKVCMAGYWNNQKATAETLKEGWVHTGDIGWIDEEGYLYLVDRKKDIIISGGENIYSREIEDVLNGHPAIAEAAVFGIPDEKWGEAVKAVVALKPGMTAQSNEIIEYCKERLSSFKKPKGVDFIAELPKTAANKINKRALRDPYWIGRERNV